MSGLIVFFLVVGVLWVAPILLARKMARTFALSSTTWLWALFLGWIGVLVVMAKGTRQMTTREGIEKMYNRPEAGEAVDTAKQMLAHFQEPKKACPDCAEKVSDAAKVCSHCGHRFEQATA
jgi:hypothetical protein